MCNRDHGLSYDEKAYKSAQRKIQEAEKYGKTRHQEYEPGRRGTSAFSDIWNGVKSAAVGIAGIAVVVGEAIWSFQQSLVGGASAFALSGGSGNGGGSWYSSCYG